MASTFTKHKIVLSPLENPRSWLVFGFALVCLIVVVQMPRGWDLVGALRLVLLGVAGYVASAAIEHLPVRGTVAAEGGVAFLGRIAQFGYVPLKETKEGRVFVRKGNSPLRAMLFTPIIIGNMHEHAAGAEIPVTVPLRFYRALKRIQA